MRNFFKARSFAVASLVASLGASIVFLIAGCRLRSSLIETESGAQADAIPFAKAGSEITSGLAAVHAGNFASAPAAIRPDPDLYARRLLKTFRYDGNTLARQLGRVERFRLMLGGASEDFRTVPQESYDATSLLTLQKVAEDICTSLVAPNAWDHADWQTVLTAAPADIDSNLRLLMKKMLGLPESSLSQDALAELADMVRADAVNGVVSNSSYITACTAMAMDAEALLL